MATIIRTSRAKLPKRSAGGAKSQVTSIRRFVPPARPHKPFPVVARGLPHKNGLNDQHSEVKQRGLHRLQLYKCSASKSEDRQGSDYPSSRIGRKSPCTCSTAGRFWTDCKSDTIADFVHRDHRGAYCRISSSTAGGRFSQIQSKSCRCPHPKSLRISLRRENIDPINALKEWSERQDLNLRPLRPERSALPG